MEIENINKKFIGVWELVSCDMKSKEGKNLGKWKAKGRLVYNDKGYISAQLMGLDRPIFKSRKQYKGTVEEIKKAFNECSSYYGTYEIDEKSRRVIHHIESSLFPNWEGTIQERFFTFFDDQLELMAQIPETGIVYLLRWKKI
ncbi:MAG: lipocalin-like domain-containing protein [Promethearchaeota archaeon]